MNRFRQIRDQARYRALDGCAHRLPRRLPEAGGAVVVYTPGHLGDVLHAIPMLRALRAGRPDATITWLVGPWSEALARRYAGLVDGIRVFGPNLPPYTRGKRAWKQSARTQWRMALALRREGAQALIGPLDGAGRFLANALVPPLWAGIGDQRPPRVRPEIRTCVQPYEKDRYEADALCGLLKSLGVEARAERLEYAVSAEEAAAAERFLAAEGMAGPAPLALIAPGSGWSGKNWLSERFGAVARWLTEERGFRVAWVGGAEEEALVPADRRGDGQWIGKTDLPLLAALMQRARLWIGNDGGLLHLAAAVGLPTVSLWGPTSPGKWAPRGGAHRWIRKVDRCAGCIYWDWREACRQDRACMKAIAVEEVQAAIGDVLSGPPRGEG